MEDYPKFLTTIRIGKEVLELAKADDRVFIEDNLGTAVKTM
jgi:hypothetical protein